MNIQIKQERFATRCEVCHQADQFDPQAESCGRCSILVLGRHEVVSAPMWPEGKEELSVVAFSMFLSECDDLILSWLSGIGIIGAALGIYSYNFGLFLCSLMLPVFSIAVAAVRTVGKFVKYKTNG